MPNNALLTFGPKSLEFSRLASKMISKLFNQRIIILSQSPNSKTPHPVPFDTFVHQLLQEANLDDNIPILALYYIAKLKVKNPTMKMVITIKKILFVNGLYQLHGLEYRLFVASLIIAQKILDDFRFTNSYWAKLSRVPIEHINRMEVEILLRLNWNVSLSSSDLNNYEKN